MRKSSGIVVFWSYIRFGVVSDTMMGRLENTKNTVLDVFYIKYIKTISKVNIYI